ncbi:gp025 [Rhodococcus phage ReqiDocB7]|uniref:gp025 n=1 Tax=Rhodococcus phage ReqiDocB7 TaxID=691966 RepID=UPI0001CDD75B|nr:gp025 [Rhodococcus phage ReqiDocB7]ADD80811.1 gp025 [Rhodococcus phage ReqiDocB7]
MTKNFGNFNTAEELVRAMRQIAQDEISKARPALRSAEVISFVENEKAVMVRFVGEPEAVKVPYNSVAPSYAGQYVRVGGTQGDRAVQEVMGDSDDLARIKTLEDTSKARDPDFLYHTIVADWTPARAATVRVPFVGFVETSKFVDNPISIDPSGLVTFNEDGYYKIHSKMGFNTGSSGAEYVHGWLQKITPGGSWDIDQDTYDARGMDGERAEGGIHLFGFSHFLAGEQLSVNIYTSAGRTLFKTKTNLYVEMKKRGPRSVAPS